MRTLLRGIFRRPSTGSPSVEAQLFGLVEPVSERAVGERRIGKFPLVPDPIRTRP
jgi:hypothetical protein